MMQKSDPGLSMAVGFVMILMIIAMIIGVWAVVGVPEQIRDAEDYHAVGVTNTFLDYKIAVDNQRAHEWIGSNVSMLIPAASAYADGALFMTEDVGTLRVLIGGTENSAYDISRLYATFGTTNTRIGYEAAGVYRNDYGSAVWVTPPSITIEKSGDDVYVTLIVPEMQGSFAVGSSEGIPVDTGLISVTTPVDISTNQMITIIYTADELWDADVWNTFFYETKLKYQSAGVDIMSQALSPYETSLTIYPSPGGDMYLTLIKPVYIVDVRRH
ncbi:MAG: hypothetical protein Q7J08_06400 [Methanocorpusculum sp.]|uniref:DUF7289 family protein n=1 Tax=Methanocorpusculum sp. TaxID=2058474 RepID=UPI00271F5AB3|nr:hypothetical protein [Methanocorpusculum sp.]MDO9523326.1 hypothetical protein [Methanocorpusculum sp.]